MDVWTPFLAGMLWLIGATLVAKRASEKGERWAGTVRAIEADMKRHARTPAIRDEQAARLATCKHWAHIHLVAKWTALLTWPLYAVAGAVYYVVHEFRKDWMGEG